MGQEEYITPLIWTIYLVILGYFILGAVGFYVINRKKSREIARKSYIKFGTYFLIIHILFFSISFWPVLFQFWSIVIIGIGSIELARLYGKSGRQLTGFFFASMLVFLLLSVGFILFGFLKQNLILYGFLIVSIFDSFSQISGQLWGRKPILPTISPNKTVGGIVGGALIALVSSLFLAGLYDASLQERLLLTTGIILFAFLGDAMASLYKRKYKVKDYSQIIPGHGGFLDRFDSLIAGGAWVVIYFYIFY